jgi:hypothetical protein
MIVMSGDNLISYTCIDGSKVTLIELIDHIEWNSLHSQYLCPLIPKIHGSLPKNHSSGVKGQTWTCLPSHKKPQPALMTDVLLWLWKGYTAIDSNSLLIHVSMLLEFLLVWANCYWTVVQIQHRVIIRLSTVKLYHTVWCHSVVHDWVARPGIYIIPSQLSQLSPMQYSHSCSPLGW